MVAKHLIPSEDASGKAHVPLLSGALSCRGKAQNGLSQEPGRHEYVAISLSPRMTRPSTALQYCRVMHLQAATRPAWKRGVELLVYLSP